MIHQVLGGAQGQASDIDSAARNIGNAKQMLNRMLAEMTGQNLEKIAIDDVII